MDIVVAVTICMLIIFGIICACFVIPVNNRKKALDAARAAVNEHFKTLVRLRDQLGGTDNYGKYVDRGWVKEVTYFLNSEVPEHHRKHLKPVDIEKIIVEELNNRPNETAKVSFKQRFAQVTTGVQFEHFIKNELISLGWQVHHIGGSGDQGADLIVSQDLFRVAVQCKLYSKPLSNQSVQEVVAAQKFHDTHAAVVISNQPFNKSAQALARANDVVHIPHDDLELFDHLFLVEVGHHTNRPKVPKVETPEDRFSKITTSEQFKRFIWAELLGLGWEVQDVEGRSYQGADLIASRNNYRLAIQCTLYSKPLTSLSVQQAAAARGHYQADDAVVVSNHPFDELAEALAKTNFIFHIPYNDLEQFNELYLSSTDGRG